MSTLVLPQRLVGEANTRNVEMSPASIVQACSTQSDNASAAPGGSTMYFSNSPLMSASSSAPGTASAQGSTFQCGRADASSWECACCLRTASSSALTLTPNSSAVSLRRLSYSSGDFVRSFASSMTV